MVKLEDLKWEKSQIPLKIPNTSHEIDLVREGWITLDTTKENQQIRVLDSEKTTPHILSGEVLISQIGCSSFSMEFPLIVKDSSKAEVIPLKNCLK